MRLAILLAFAAVPLLEVGILIRVGQSVGFWKLALFVIAAAVLGGVVIRRVGLSMFREALHDIGRGREGLAPLLDGFLQVTAGMLLIFPGLISDAIGLMLLFPPVRRQIIASNMLKAFGPAAANDDARRTDDVSSSTPRGRGVTIEGEYERLDEQSTKPQTALQRQSLRRR